MKTTTTPNQMTTVKVASIDFTIPNDMIKNKELILGYNSIIPKNASIDYEEDMWEIMYDDISYSTNRVSDFFTKLNMFWDTYGIHYPYLPYVYQTMLSKGVIISFMCRLDTQDNIKLFDKVFNGNLNNHTILQYHKNELKREFIVSIIDTDSKKVKVFEINYEKYMVLQPTSMVGILFNCTSNTYQFDYEIENYFEKNNNNGITYSFKLMEVLLKNERIDWSWEEG